jgi:hypothetical protein
VTGTLDSGANAGGLSHSSSTAIDSLDRVFISYGYGDVTHSDIKLVSNTSGIWSIETACDRFLGCGEYNSVAVDGTGSLHISSHGNDGTLLFTTGVPTPAAGGIRRPPQSASEAGIRRSQRWGIPCFCSLALSRLCSSSGGRGGKGDSALHVCQIGAVFRPGYHRREMQS